MLSNPYTTQFLEKTEANKENMSMRQDMPLELQVVMNECAKRLRGDTPTPHEIDAEWQTMAAIKKEVANNDFARADLLQPTYKRFLQAVAKQQSRDRNEEWVKHNPSFHGLWEVLQLRGLGHAILSWQTGEFWGFVNGQTDTAWNITSGRIAKKRTENTAWRWADRDWYSNRFGLSFGAEEYPLRDPYLNEDDEEEHGPHFCFSPRDPPPDLSVYRA